MFQQKSLFKTDKFQNGKTHLWMRKLQKNLHDTDISNTSILTEMRQHCRVCFLNSSHKCEFGGEIGL